MLSSTPTITNRKIAVLIDGDNAQPSLLEKILAETSKYGMITVRRIYGDWTTPNMGRWKDTLHTHAIQPIQQFRYTVGKNATDSAMIIDAMDIMYEGGVDGFCIVSSDSDYTRLATRIREKGFFVMGVGKKGTPRAFVNACEVFVITENLSPEMELIKSEETRKTVDSSKTMAPDPLSLLKEAFEVSVQEDGWAPLTAIGQALRQRDPAFDSRTYGYKQLSLLIQAYQKVFTVKKNAKGLQVKLTANS